MANNGGNDAPAAGAARFMSQAEMSRLPQFKGNNKDSITAEAWTEMVDRHITVLKWNAEQTAGAAIEALRDEANVWRENLQNGRADQKAILKDWTVMRTAFLERFTRVGSRATKVQNLGNLKQGNGETCAAFGDRVIHALDKLTATAYATQNNDNRKTGFMACRDLLEGAIFLCGIKNDIRLWVEMDMTDQSSNEDLRKLAQKAEIALGTRNSGNPKVHAITATTEKEEGHVTDLKNELKELKATVRALSKGETVAAMSKSSSAGAMRPRRPLPPMGERDRPIHCWRCRQWGKHTKTECRLTDAQVANLTPMKKEDKPEGMEFIDAQFPNA